MNRRAFGSTRYEASCLEAARGGCRRTGGRSVPTAAAALLEVEELPRATQGEPRRESATVEAVRGVSFRIGAGEALGLVGESGSGKTSIARCILGLSAAEAGRCGWKTQTSPTTADWVEARIAQVRGSVQMVFQDPYASLNPRTLGRLGACEAIQAPRVDGVDTATEVAALLEAVGLPEHYASRRPRALSGGERQRVAIARAVACSRSSSSATNRSPRSTYPSRLRSSSCFAIFADNEDRACSSSHTTSRWSAR